MKLISNVRGFQPGTAIVATCLSSAAWAMPASSALALTTNERVQSRIELSSAVGTDSLAILVPPNSLRRRPLSLPIRQSFHARHATLAHAAAGLLSTLQ